MKTVTFSHFVGVLLTSGFANFVSAGFINFDNLTPGSIENIDISGVTISSDGTTFAEILKSNETGFGYISANNTVSNSVYLKNGSNLVFTFSEDQNFVSFYAGDNGGDQDRFCVDVYTADNNLIQTYDSGLFGGSAYPVNNYYMVDNAFIQISDIGFFRKFVVRDAINYGLLIDDLTFENRDVPEPGVLSLISFGIIAIGLVVKRKF